MGDRGVTGMFVGYTSNHERNCYRMWNPNTQKDSKTHGVVFLNMMFFRTPTMQPQQSPIRQERGYYNCGFSHM
jgi:hypothetical protein